MTANLLEVATRVEGARAEEQRELLIAAFETFKGPRDSYVPGRIRRWHPQWFAFEKMLNAEAFESAAMTLVPEGGSFQVSRGMDADRTGFANISVAGDDPAVEPKDFHAFAATPALALTAAALRALAARAGEAE